MMQEKLSADVLAYYRVLVALEESGKHAAYAKALLIQSVAATHKIGPEDSMDMESGVITRASTARPYLHRANSDSPAGGENGESNEEGHDEEVGVGGPERSGHEQQAGTGAGN
jgi:hypothetical protein